MKPEKLAKLFAAARKEAPPAPPAGFESRVLSALRRQAQAEAVPLLDQLTGLFPRLVTVGLAIIILCAAADWCGAAWGAGDLTSGVEQISEQWLFAAKGF